MADPKLTMDIVVKQNTGLDPGLRAWGANDSWDWTTHGWPATGKKRPPAGFTSVTGYGHGYMERDKPFAETGILVKEFTCYVHKVGGGWLKVQAQHTHSLAHGYWKGDFTIAKGTTPAIVRNTGVTPIEDRIVCPRGGDIEHWWGGARGQYPANTIDGAFTSYLAKIDNGAAHVIYAAGIDWWRDTSVGYVPPPGTNNPALSCASWTKLTTEWQWCTSTDSTEAQLSADPPPSMSGGEPIPPEPEPEPEPVSGITIKINGQPMKPTDSILIEMTGTIGFAQSGPRAEKQE